MNSCFEINVPLRRSFYVPVTLWRSYRGSSRVMATALVSLVMKKLAAFLAPKSNEVNRGFIRTGNDSHVTVNIVVGDPSVLSELINQFAPPKILPSEAYQPSDDRPRLPGD